MEITNLPQVSIKDRHFLPRTSGIYFVVNELGEVLYIGKTKNLRQRWQNHHLINYNWRIVYFEAEYCSLPGLETQLIRKFLPRLNKQHCHTVYTVLAYRKKLLSCLPQSKNF
ncbi:hypothetical protein PL11201_680050 [Planktothrix sp. PCC 11201]|uniref:GIY-YIG nuclease family protein n=1 Tax=Planktothrix sp. PCC 11201 TaxID=1729650 RepID=UPI000921BECB|nr:hypothetical protein PL11201_680050 [Planktothrix sp. PCC 11201]